MTFAFLDIILYATATESGNAIASVPFRLAIRKSHLSLKQVERSDSIDECTGLLYRRVLFGCSGLDVLTGAASYLISLADQRWMRFSIRGCFTYIFQRRKIARLSFCSGKSREERHKANVPCQEYYKKGKTDHHAK